MADLCSLKDVKDYLGMGPDETKSDGLLTWLISAVSERLAGMVGRTFEATNYTEVRDGDGSESLVLWRDPVIGVTSVSIDGVAVPSSNWTRAGDRLSLIDGVFTSGAGNVSVVYRAGYESIPKDAQQIAIEMTAEENQRRTRLGIMSSSTNGQTVSYQTLTLNTAAQAFIERYGPRGGF